IDLVQELAEGDVLRRHPLPRVLKQHDQRNDEQDYDYPKCKIPEIRIHLRSRHTSAPAQGPSPVKPTPAKNWASSNVSPVFPIAKGDLHFGQVQASPARVYFPVPGALRLPAR